MASRNSSSDARANVQRSNRDSARWVAGLVVLLGGVFAAAAVVFSFFTWKSDQSVLQGYTDEQRELLGLAVENLCGPLGTRIGEALVGRSFGVFGVLIPVMLILIGVRIIRQQPLRFNRSILPLLLVAILGSLTLGCLFGDRWCFCSSGGWGGAFGAEIASLWTIDLPVPHVGALPRLIGSVGTLLLLAGGWILTGVYINRSFIDRVNHAGNAVVDRSGRIFGVVRRKVAPHGVDDAELPADEEFVGEPDAEAGVAEAAGEADEVVPEETAPVREPQPADVPTSGRESVQEDAADENPCLDSDAERTGVRGGAAEDDVSVEVDLDEDRSAERVVMGAGGLVVLERSARRTEPASDGPFTELTLEGAPSASGSAAESTAESTVGADARMRGHHDRVESDDEPFTEIPLVARRPETESHAPVAGDTPAEGLPEAAERGDADAALEPEGVVVTVEAHEARMVDEGSITTESYDPLKDLVNYRKPPVSLLEDYFSDSEVSDEEIFENKSRIEETLKNFGIPIQRIKATVGPTVTLYEIVQAQGIKISKVQGLENDIAQSLKALGIRIIAPIPGKGTIGIEVPNRDKQVVSMYSSVRSLRFQESKAELPVVIGRTIQNENYVFDLAKMPHLLVAGATGQGKSVGLNAIITSLLYRKHPAQLKFVMIDPKMVEFSLYGKLERHFLAKMESEEKAIITDPMKAVYTLNALCTEMDNRLELCSEAGARNIVEYNEKFTARRLNPQKGHRYLPYIVVVVDEFADLIMMAREVERPVMRLAQKARAVGIHLIIATQRPDVKVITGGIKANFPARIAFRVMQMIDSRTIIDQPGANQLIGRGDMLFSKDGELTRIQCALVETKEVERIVEHIAGQQSYTAAYPLPDYTPEGGEGAAMGSGDESSAPVRYDTLFAEIARDAVQNGQISTSMIQRNYEVGFNRAGRIMLQLERAGIVGRQQGAKPRDILFHDAQSLEAKLQDLGIF